MWRWHGSCGGRTSQWGASPVTCLTSVTRTVLQISFLAGLMYIGLGVLRLGFLTNFLSHSVISGFTSGAAIVIGLSQV